MRGLSWLWVRVDVVPRIQSYTYRRKRTLVATEKSQHPGFYAIIVMLIIMSVGPIAIMLINSFKLDVDIMSGTSGLLLMPTIQNYETALCDILPYGLDHLDVCALKFGGAFINSLIIALVSAVLTLIIGCMAAYAHWLDFDFWAAIQPLRQH